MERTGPPSCSPAAGGSSPIPCPWYAVFAHCSHVYQRRDPAWASGWCVSLNPGKASTRTSMVLAGWWEIYASSGHPQTSLVGKSPCLLNLPSAGLEWLTLPSLSALRVKGQFQISPGTLLFLQTSTPVYASIKKTTYLSIYHLFFILYYWNHVIYIIFALASFMESMVSQDTMDVFISGNLMVTHCGFNLHFSITN